MFIAKWEIDNETINYIYANNGDGWNIFHRDTFSPQIKNIDILILRVSGETYEEKQENARQLAINWQVRFSSLDWSYGELSEIASYFERLGKRYGLLKEFKENAIC